MRFPVDLPKLCEHDPARVVAIAQLVETPGGAALLRALEIDGAAESARLVQDPTVDPADPSNHVLYRCGAVWGRNRSREIVEACKEQLRKGVQL